MARLMVLGLLTNGPMSGYQLHQTLQMVQSDKWAGILPGSIYHALKKMEKEQLVELDSVEQTGNRSKAIYRITPNGEEELKKLVLESLRSSSMTFPTSLYAGLSFLEQIPLEQALAALEQQIAIVKRNYAELKDGEQQKKAVAHDLPLHVQLSFDNMYDQFELHLSFLQKLKAALFDQREKQMAAESRGIPPQNRKEDFR